MKTEYKIMDITVREDIISTRHHGTNKFVQTILGLSPIEGVRGKDMDVEIRVRHFFSGPSDDWTEFKPGDKIKLNIERSLNETR